METVDSLYGLDQRPIDDLDKDKPTMFARLRNGTNQTQINSSKNLLTFRLDSLPDTRREFIQKH